MQYKEIRAPDKGCPDRIRWLPKCTSMRSRPGWIEPEVYFRIVHLAQEGHKSAPVAACCEQTVEIALGPTRAFDPDQNRVH